MCFSQCFQRFGRMSGCLQSEPVCFFCTDLYEDGQWDDVFVFVHVKLLRSGEAVFGRSLCELCGEHGVYVSFGAGGQWRRHVCNAGVFFG